MSIKINDELRNLDESPPNRSIIRVSTQAYQDCNGCFVIKKTIRPMRRLSLSTNGQHLLDGEIEATSPIDVLEYGMPDLQTLSDGLYEIHGHLDISYYGEYDVDYSFSKYEPKDKNENT